MGKIFVGQTELRIELTVNQDITGATTTEIRYEKPNITKTSSAWTATIKNATLGIIEYQIKTGDLDLAGTWIIWAYVTFASGNSSPGEAIEMEVYNEGETS